MRLKSHDKATTRGPKRLVLGFTALASAALISAAGLAGATPDGKPTKDQCSKAGYKNYGQCVSAWAQAKSHGYGGGTASIHNEVNTNVGINVEGNDNVVSVAINYLFGN